MTHKRLLDQWITKNMALMCMVNRQRKCTAHHGMATQGAIKTRHPTHFQDQTNSFPFLPQQPANGILKLHFAAGVRAITQLIFQPLEANRVALPVRQKRGTKAGQTARGLCQHQMRIALRHREKSFMPHQPIRTIVQTLCAGGVAHDIGTALLFRHSHADQQATFLPTWQ